MSSSDPLGAFVPGPCLELLPTSGAGPLHGLRFAAKDNFDVAGHVSGAGNPDWLRTHAPAEATAPAVQRLLDAGASLCGKTVMDELAYGSLGENAHYGTPANPAAPGRVPGGSSSGSASAVAGGLVDFALGTDSACSVRLPAAFCGLFALRPTHGRVSTEGVVPLSPSLDTVGWLARSADVMSKVGRVLLEPGPAQLRPPRRLLVADDAFALAQSATRDALAPVVERWAEHIGPIERIEIGEPDTARAVGLFLMRSGSLQIREVWACHGSWIRNTRPRSDVLTADNLAMGAESTPGQMEDARREWDALARWIQARIPSDAVLALPTAAGPAPLRGLSPEARQAYTFPSLALLSIAVLGGLPQLTLPVATVDGLPVGLSLVGAQATDEAILELALHLDRLAVRSR